MKCSLLISGFLTCFSTLFGQNHESDTSIIRAYSGIRQFFSLMYEDCVDLILLTDNGEVEKYDSACSYVYIPKSFGESSIEVFRVLGKDTVKVSEKKVVINRWPEQPAEYCRMTSGQVSIPKFLTAREVIARVSGFDMSGKHKVLSFTIKILRHGEVIYFAPNKGGVVENQSQQKFEHIQGGDLVFFEEILAVIPGEKYPRKLNSIYLEIVGNN